jgi:DNA-binding CsgD family transcriptional regulator
MGARTRILTCTKEATSDFEIAAARLFVQQGLSTPQIGERLGCNRRKVGAALERVGIKPDGRRNEWRG